MSEDVVSLSGSDEGPALDLGSSCEVMLCFAPSNSHIVRFVQVLRFRLCEMGIPCTMSLTAEIGGIRWRREVVKLLKRTAVCVVLITADWLKRGENHLALYYALRRSLACASPIVIPVIFPDAVVLNHKLVEQLVAQSFHIVYTPPNPLEGVLAKLRNFMVAFKFPVPDHHLGEGRSLREVYSHFVKQKLKKRPNSALMKLMDTLPKLKELNLSTDATSSPPTVYLVGDAGLSALLEVVKLLPGLRKLDLRGNGLTTACVNDLVRALVTHPGVVSLDLRDNDITQSAAPDLYHLICTNQQIRELELPVHCFKSSVWLRRIDQQLEANRGCVFGSWGNVEDGYGEYNEHTESEWWESRAALEEPLDPAKAHLWDVVLSCHPVEATPLEVLAKSKAAVRLRVSVFSNGESTPRIDEELAVDHPLRLATLSYLQQVECNTCAVRKMKGSTLKLVLETAGQGLEGLCEAVRAHVREKVPTALYDGLQRVSAKVLFERRPNTRGVSFFIDSELWYAGSSRVGRTVPQLFRENIGRYVGSLGHEIELLIQHLFDEDMLLDEERQAYAEMEEEEDEKHQREEEESMNSIIRYWRVNTPVFKKQVPADLLHVFKGRKEAMLLRPIEKEAKNAASLKKLKAIKARYTDMCTESPGYPPYWY